MALKDLQDKLKALVQEGETIAAKADLATGDMERLQAISTEGKSIKSAMEALQGARELSEWGRQSAGMLPMAEVVGFGAAGQATVENKKGNLLVNDEGECLMDLKTYQAISKPEYRQAFRSYLRGGERGLKSNEMKTLQEGSDPAGGYLVPDDILNRLIAKEPAPYTVASRVNRMNTSRDALVIPKVNYTTDNQYTSGMRVTWTGEIPASATTHRVTDPVFAQVRIPIYTAMLSLPLTNDMVEDASYPIVNWCTSKFDETISLLYEDMVLNGTGVGRPSGILVNPNATDNPATVASGAAAALTADGLVSLAFALPEQYDRNASFVMNKTNTAQAIAKLKDGDGRYLWGSGMQDSGLAVPAVNGTRGRSLLGYDVVFNAFMPNVAASAYPIIFGDLGGYYLVNRIGFSIQVLRELYAETNQVLLLGRIRFGGLVVEDWKLRIQTVSA